MEIEFLGGNCFRIKTKNVTVIVDDNLAKIGGQSPQSDKTVAFYTSQDVKGEVKTTSRLVIDTPGEFEVGDLTVTGVQTRGHMDEDGKQSATVYQFMLSGQTVTVLGHVHPDLAPEVSELAGGTEVLIVPVGGNGYTLDPTGAASIVKSVEPGVVIPSQYDIQGLSYEMPAQPLEAFTKMLTTEELTPVDSYKLVRSATEDLGSSQTKVVVLSRLSK